MVAKYKSRRRTQRRIPPGGLKKKKKAGGLKIASAAKSIAKLVVPAQHDVHTSALHPQDIVQAIQHQPEIEHIGRELLQQHENVKRYAKKVRFPRWMSHKPVRNVDVAAMAKSIYKKHRHRHMPKLGGSLSSGFDKLAGYADKNLNPLRELEKGVQQYNKINFNTAFDNPRNFAKTAMAAEAGNFHLGSAALKGYAAAATTNPVLYPVVAPLEGGGQLLNNIALQIQGVNEAT